MTISRVGFFILLLALCCFCFYMFWVNIQNLKEYHLENSKEIVGKLESFKKERWRGGISFTMRLEGFTNSFSVPTPEWKSFDFDSFQSTVQEGDNVILSIPESAKVNSTVIKVFQIKARNKNFIDFKKMVAERKLEMYLAFILGTLSLIATIYYRPWKFR